MTNCEKFVQNGETPDSENLSSSTIYGILDRNSEEFLRVQKEIKAKKEKNPSLKVIGVAIDILRASTTVTYLLAMGAKYVLVSDQSPAIMRETVISKNNQGKKYVDIGSDASGDVIFTLPNSPYNVVLNRKLIKDSVPVINTSKGGVVAINALDVGCDEVLFASLPTFSATLSYVKNLAARQDIEIYCFATEGNLNESQELTEDALFAKAFNIGLQNKAINHGELQEKIYNNRGARRFFRGKAAFPSQDVVLTIQPPDLYNFVPRAVKKLDEVVTTAFYGDRHKNEGEELVTALKDTYQFSSQHPVISNLSQYYPELTPDKIIDRMYLAYLRHRNLFLHIISLCDLVKNISKKNNLDIKTTEEALLLVLYHDAAKLITTEEISGFEMKKGNHSKKIQDIFENIGESLFAHNLRHNSVQFIHDFQSGAITFPQLLLNICDRLDISGEKTDIQGKFSHVIHQHGRKKFDLKSELLACHLIEECINIHTLELNQTVLETIL